MARSITYDQEKIKELRMSLTDACILVMSDDKADNKRVKKWSKFKKEMILKMAPRVLPTLTLLGNEDDKPFKTEGVEIIVRK